MPPSGGHKNDRECFSEEVSQAVFMGWGSREECSG